MVPASELAQLQKDMVAAVCDKTCQIYHKATATDNYGTSVDTWNVLSATVPAGMRQPSAGELANYDYEIGDKAAWTVVMPVGTVVNHQDHLVIEGQTLEVHILLTPRSYPALLDVIAVEIK